MKEEDSSPHRTPQKTFPGARERSHFTDLLDFATDQGGHEWRSVGVTFFKYPFAVSSKTQRSMRVQTSVFNEHEHVNKLFKECKRIFREF